ncbi:hypothetical protein FRB98_004740 [Tulasnella sp. 332]|nr:hypothetical protein FRB98_004740 [Tulasnella sp. 332]
MASSSKSNNLCVDHSESSGGDAQRLHQQPKPLSCASCREKKRLCDKRKPSCGLCLSLDKDCVYVNRKPRVTIEDLEEELRRLERKYTTFQKAADSGTTKGTTKSITTAPSRQCVMEAIADRQRYSNNLRYNSTFSDPPFDGYHFDESFLAAPSCIMGGSSRFPVASSQSGNAATTTHIRPYPTRIFTPVLRITPTKTFGLQNGSFQMVDPWHLEEQRTEVRPAKRRRLKSPTTAEGFGVTIDDGALNIPNLFHRRFPASISIVHAPTLHFTRETWWDCLLSTYSVWPDGSNRTISRQDVNVEISQDVFIFFRAAPIMLYFLHVPLFFDHFYHPEHRAEIQPALVFSILAYAKLIQSNYDTRRDQSLEEREGAWKQSVVLRRLAQASFEASYNAGWMDLPLAQAAWVGTYLSITAPLVIWLFMLMEFSLDAVPLWKQIMALYEMSPHRDCTSDRMQSSVVLLDNILHAMGLSSIDAMDPSASVFAADGILGRPRLNGIREFSPRLDYRRPVMELAAQSPTTISSRLPSPSESVRGREMVSGSTPSNLWRCPEAELPLHPNDSGGSNIPTGCPCHVLSLSTTPELLRSTPAWRLTPRWVPDASDWEIKKEEARRLVWGSLMLLGCHANARRAAGLSQLDLYISRPENKSRKDSDIPYPWLERQ